KTLTQKRLITHIGQCGACKTRQESDAAARIVDTVPDGIWLVELAQVTAGTDVPRAVLGSVGLREVHLLERRNPAARDPLARLIEALRDAQAIVILDNCEHVI